MDAVIEYQNNLMYDVALYNIGSTISITIYISRLRLPNIEMSEDILVLCIVSKYQNIN